MGRELLASKIVIQEETPKIRQIVGLPLSIAAMVGIAERGAIGVAKYATSFAEWFKEFGGDVAAGISASAVRGFFQNGGQALWFTRTAHYSNLDLGTLATAAKATLQLSSAATAPTAGYVQGTATAPFDLEPGDTLSVKVDGGGAAAATFAATAASRTAGNVETYDLADGLTLLVQVDGGPTQTITFLTAEFVSIVAATALEVAAVINAKIVGAHATVAGGAPIITSDTRGTGSAINVTGGTANSGGVNRLGFVTGLIAGTGNVANIDAVAVAEVKSVVEAAVTGCTVTDVGGSARITSNTTGVLSSIQVEAISTADDEIGLDNAVHSGGSGAAAPTVRFDGKSYGAYGNEVEFVVSNATNGVTDDFNLGVVFKGVTVELFPNLSMLSTADRYFATIINHADTGSDYVVATDLALGLRPANSPLVGGAPDPYGPMTSGDDGLTALADTDFIGSSVSKTGLQSFNTKSDVRLLCVPEQPTPAVASAMISYCENERAGGCFAIIDLPSGYTKDQAKTYVLTTAALKGLSEYGATYWPHLKVLNPDSTVYGNDETIVCPPSGHIAGFYGKIAAARDGGIYDQPAGFGSGMRLAGLAGLETDEVNDEAVRDLLYPECINPIVSPGYLDGTKTLKQDGNFPSIGERRGVIHIEFSVRSGIEYARHANQTTSLRASVKRSIDLFLLQQWRKGAFRGDTPSDSFYSDVGPGINPASEVFAQRMNVAIGLATNKPTEWIIIKVSQDTRALEEELASAGL
jgi:hypothetical protein